MTVGGVSAVIVSQSDGSVVIQAPSDISGTGDIIISSPSAGKTVSSLQYTANPPGVITSINPATGPYAGGNLITITGTGLGNGSDITSVLLGGVQASIASQTASTVVVKVPFIGNDTTVNITVISVSTGTTRASDTYTINPQGIINNVTPNNGPFAGGGYITITGIHLGNGSDITSVTFGNAAATIISQSSSIVVVQLPPTASSSAGSVVLSINSTSYGSTQLRSTFTYNGAPIITSVSPNFGSPSGGDIVTILGMNLGNGSDVSSVVIVGVNATIIYQSSTNITVITAAKNVTATGDILVYSEHYGIAVGTFSYSSCSLGFVLNNFNNCEACPAGSFSNGTSQATCSLCDKGSFNSELNATTCESCPTGTYANITGMSTCYTCPADRPFTMPGASQMSDCFGMSISIYCMQVCI